MTWPGFSDTEKTSWFFWMVPQNISKYVNISCNFIRNPTTTSLHKSPFYWYNTSPIYGYGKKMKKNGVSIDYSIGTPSVAISSIEPC